MSITCRTVAILCLLFPLFGCTADPDSSAETKSSTAVAERSDDVISSSSSGVSTNVETATTESADEVEETTDASSTEDAARDSQADRAAADAVDTPESADEEANSIPLEQQELTTVEDYFKALRAKLDGVPATPELINESLALAEEGKAKLDDNLEMAGLLGSLLFQTVRFEEDEEVLQQRRLRMGELAKQISESPDFTQLAQVLYYEEGKAHVANKEMRKAFESVTAARELGFTEVRAFFLDDDYKLLAESSEFGDQLKNMLRSAIEEQMAAFEPFDFTFSLTSFDGDKVSAADFLGKPMLVDFWGTWCGPCREAVPHLVELTEKYGDKIAVVGINFESNRGDLPYEEARALYERFTQIQPINYPCVHGSYAYAETVPGFEGKFPTMYFVDADGKAVLKGFFIPEELEMVIEMLLERQKQAEADA